MFFDSISAGLSEGRIEVPETELNEAKRPSKFQANFSHLKRRVLRMMKGSYESVLSSGIQQHAGHVYTIQLPDYLTSDKDGKSSIVLYEDGRRLPLAHAMHSEIAEIGMGRYSHWESWLLFTASDNSNPLDNGRTYAVREE